MIIISYFNNELEQQGSSKKKKTMSVFTYFCDTCQAALILAKGLLHYATQTIHAFQSVTGIWPCDNPTYLKKNNLHIYTQISQSSGIQSSGNSTTRRDGESLE